MLAANHLLGWWDNENELALRVWVRRSRTESWRPAVEGESVCVWDLEIIWAERQAWVACMLAFTGSDRDGYLTAVDERHRSDTPSGHHQADQICQRG